MKKLVLPALAIAAVGGYFYYTNLESSAQPVATAEEAIVDDVKSAITEAEAAGANITPAAEDVTAAADGDVFADVPEAMGHVLDEISESVEGGADSMADSAADVDHAHE